MIYNERGEIISSSIDKNRDNNANTRILKTQFLEKEDSQTVQQIQLAGFESRPHPGTKIIIVDLGGGAYKISIGEDDGILNDTLNEGESIFYSSNGSIIKAFIKALDSGVLEVNGNADYAVRFNALQTEFNALRDDYNAHKHSGVQTGSGTSGITDTVSTADITPAKVDEVKLP
jgi:phage gp45-like